MKPLSPLDRVSVYQQPQMQGLMVTQLVYPPLAPAVFEEAVFYPALADSSLF